MPSSFKESQWKLTLAYDGTEFHGWQIQPGLPTIQGTLADAIASITGERVVPQGSGRTDTGVHALGQVASFALAASIPADNLKHALNRLLPAAIRIVAAEHAPPDFHARHSALSKVYQYRIFQGSVCSPFLSRYLACCRWPLDLAAMQQAAAEILGEHDFTSFAASDPDRSARMQSETAVRIPRETGGAARGVECDFERNENDRIQNIRIQNIRIVEQSEWSRVSFSNAEASMSNPTDHPFGGLFGNPWDLTAGENMQEFLLYTVRGNGFLHHMVRNLVGTFLEIGRGRLAVSSMAGILHGRDRTLAGPTAPAKGLSLMQVTYPLQKYKVEE